MKASGRPEPVREANGHVRVEGELRPKKPSVSERLWRWDVRVESVGGRKQSLQ